MNISKTYERINAPVVPSPRLMEKTLAKIRRSGFPRRRLAAIAAAAAVWGVCMLMELINRKCKKENKENKKDADEHANAENTDSEKEKKSGNRKTGLMLYVGSLGICAVMWIFVFVAAML